MIKRLFLEHPESVDETFLEHMGFALWFAYKLAGAASAALIHAFLPFCFETTASRTINELHTRIHSRANAAANVNAEQDAQQIA